MIRTLLLEPLLNILLFIYALMPGAGFGVAVIVLTIILRLAMWPLVKKQLHQQKAMKELQPEIAKIKKKAKGNKQKESELMMELFKEKGVNPFGSIGIALVQLPVLIALFFVLREVVTGEIAESTYAFVQSFPAIQEIIANPEAFDPTLFGYFHMADPSIILAAIAGLAQYAQAKQVTPQNMFGSDPNKKTGFNFMLFLPVVTVAVASQLPSALALYWGVSSIVAVIQQHIILKEDVTFMQKLGSLGGKKTPAVNEPGTKPTKKAATKTKAKPKDSQKPAAKTPAKARKG